MTRDPDPSRKSELLAQILEYLLDKTLATVSFRMLASALDVSTFTLVYHFGTRAELLSDIVSAISVGERDLIADFDADGDVEAYLAGLERSWEWTVQPRARQALRLAFEASMMEAQDPASHSFTRALHGQWLRIGTDALLRFGLSKPHAEAEARLIANTIFGLRYDLVINRDVDKATLAFRQMVAGHRARIEALAGAL